MTNILLAVMWPLIKEALMTIVRRLPWSTLVERLLTRFAVWALYKLAGKKTNDLTDDTVSDFASALQGKRLPAAEVKPKSGD